MSFYGDFPEGVVRELTELRQLIECERSLRWAIDRLMSEKRELLLRSYERKDCRKYHMSFETFCSDKLKMDVEQALDAYNDIHKASDTRENEKEIERNA